MDEGEKLELQGNLEGAASAYVRGKQWDNAARVAAALGRNLDAGRYWLEAKKPYEAAVCFRRVGALKECLAALQHVPNTSPRYRDACVHTVSVALILGVPLGTLMGFFMAFISKAPATPAEASALNQLADALSKEDKVRLAVSIYKSVLSAFPDDVDANEGFEALTQLGGMPAPSAPQVMGPRGPGTVQPVPSAPRPVPPTPPKVAGKGSRLAEILIARGKLVQAQLEALYRAQPAVAGSDARLAEALLGAELVTSLDMIQAYSEQSGIPYISDEKLLAGASPVAAKALALDQVEKYAVVPVSLVDKHLYIAMRDARDVTLLDKIRFASGMSHVTGIFATDFGIRRAIAKLYHGDQGADSWQSSMLEQMSSGGRGPAPFSDRFTKTREHQFDTQEFEKRMRTETGSPEAGSPEAQAPLEATVELEVSARQAQAMATPLQLPEVGSTFASRYQLLELIGEGGSAAVFRAEDKELGEPVALKLFRPSAQSESEDVIARFKLELSLSRLLAHPNIIRLFDLGSHAGWRYLTMELLEGTDLFTMLTKSGKPLPFIEGLRYLEQVCVGLQTAHERGVVHRDVKPHNLFITTDGTVKVMDFGIAKKLRSPGVTLSGMVLGTPEFISPEQINSFSAVTHLTDLYALGATAYMMFTGTPPFNHPEVMPLLMAHTNDPPPPLTSRNPDVPPALEAAILKLLEKNPANRFQSARELADVLGAIREGLEAKAKAL